MSKKLYGLLVPVLAVAAFASMPATSQAAFHFYKCEHFAAATHNRKDIGCTEATATGNFELKRLPFTGAFLQVVTWGSLTFTINTMPINTVITCKVIDAGNVWNPAGEGSGKDNVEVFVNYECKSTQCATVSLTAEKLPYETELGAGPVDKIKGVQVKSNCAGAEVIFTGELTPNVVNGTSQQVPTELEFTAGTGVLAGPAGSGLTAKVEGKDRVEGFEDGEGVQVANP